jgi:hypothetical protein
MAITISGFLKLSYLARIWTELSFLVQMLITVFMKLRIFAFYFLMVIGAFSVLIKIVAKEIGFIYDGIDKAGIFVMALRQSLGDGDTGSLIDKSNL